MRKNNLGFSTEHNDFIKSQMEAKRSQSPLYRSSTPLNGSIRSVSRRNTIGFNTNKAKDFMSNLKNLKT